MKNANFSHKTRSVPSYFLALMVFIGLNHPLSSPLIPSSAPLPARVFFIAVPVAAIPVMGKSEL